MQLTASLTCRLLKQVAAGFFQYSMQIQTGFSQNGHESTLKNKRESKSPWQRQFLKN